MNATKTLIGPDVTVQTPLELSGLSRTTAGILNAGPFGIKTDATVR